MPARARAGDWVRCQHHFTIMSGLPLAASQGRQLARPTPQTTLARGFLLPGAAPKPVSGVRVQVHYGMVLPSGYTHPGAIGPFGAPISEKCGSWLHLSNMFIARTNRTTMVADQTNWHWIFPKIQEFWEEPEWADVMDNKPLASDHRQGLR